MNVCDPWYQGVVTDDVFNGVVEKYAKEVTIDVDASDNLVVFFKKNCLYIIGAIILIFITVLLVVKVRKRSVLE